MEAAIFEVVTKAAALGALVIGYILWDRAGRPFVSIIRK